jgi:hypothetical protein
VSDADGGGSAESAAVVRNPRRPCGARGRCGCWRGCSAGVGRRPSGAMAGCVGAESAAVVPNPRRARAESMAGGARGRQLLARGRCGSGGSLHCPLIVSRDNMMLKLVGDIKTI